MNYWIIITGVLILICIFLATVYRQQRRQLLSLKQQDSDASTLQREVDRLRTDSLRRRRENASMQRELEQEQDRNDALEEDLNRCMHQLEESQRHLAASDKRRIEAEKSVYAERIRRDLLEGELKQARAELTAQEKLYQDILKEREETIVRLQEQHRRPKKKVPVMEQQISLNDILKGM